MRTSSALAATLILLGCGPDPRDTDPRAAIADGRLPCRAGGADRFSADCTVERERDGRGLLLTIRHPDGGFRRLRTTGDGRGVAAADGAEPARVAVVGRDAIEVRVGDDAYRLPATVRP